MREKALLIVAGLCLGLVSFVLALQNSWPEQSWVAVPPERAIDIDAWSLDLADVAIELPPRALPKEARGAGEIALWFARGYLASGTSSLLERVDERVRVFGWLQKSAPTLAPDYIDVIDNQEVLLLRAWLRAGAQRAEIASGWTRAAPEKVLLREQRYVDTVHWGFLLPALLGALLLVLFFALRKANLSWVLLLLPLGAYFVELFALGLWNERNPFALEFAATELPLLLLLGSALVYLFAGLVRTHLLLLAPAALLLLLNFSAGLLLCWMVLLLALPREVQVLDSSFWNRAFRWLRDKKEEIYDKKG